MEKRQLGCSDLMVSVLGMGCWQFGGGQYWGEQSQSSVNNIVDKALDLGINYFDTAEVYNDGNSELSLGNALKGKRDKAIIGTKVTPDNTDPQSLLKHCDSSLKRLQTDYIDIYMVHWPIKAHSIRHFSNNKQLIENPPSVQEAFDALSELKKSGKIRHIGISNHGVKQMQEVEETGASIIANELAYNLLSRGIEENILPACVENNIGVIGYMPLQQGLLTGKYTSFDQFNPMQARSRHFHHSRGKNSRHGESGAEKEVSKALKDIHNIANDLGVHIIELSLAWAISNSNISSIIAGSRTEKHLGLNVKGAYLKLNPEVISQLNKVTKPVLEKLGSNADYYESKRDSRID